MAKKAGRPPFVPTQEQKKVVLNLKKYLGETDEDIAKILEISRDTLKRAFAKELSEGRKIANANMAAKLYENGFKYMNVTAQIFWMKTRAGWKEHVEEAPEDGDTHYHFHSSPLPERYNKPDDDKPSE